MRIYSLRQCGGVKLVPSNCGWGQAPLLPNTNLPNFGLAMLLPLLMSTISINGCSWILVSFQLRSESLTSSPLWFLASQCSVPLLLTSERRLWLMEEKAQRGRVLCPYHIDSRLCIWLSIWGYGIGSDSENAKVNFNIFSMLMVNQDNLV